MNREQKIAAVRRHVDRAQEHYEREHPGEDFFSLSEAEQLELIRAEMEAHHAKGRLAALVDHGPFERVSY